MARQPQFGEAGLQREGAGKRATKLPAPITDKIIELKQRVKSHLRHQLIRLCADAD